MSEEPPVERPRDIIDFVLEEVWDRAVASGSAADPVQARRDGINHGYWMLFSSTRPCCRIQHGDCGAAPDADVITPP